MNVKHAIIVILLEHPTAVVMVNVFVKMAGKVRSVNVNDAKIFVKMVDLVNAMVLVGVNLVSLDLSVN